MPRYVATIRVEFNAEDVHDANAEADAMIDESLAEDHGGLREGSEVEVVSVREV